MAKTKRTSKAKKTSKRGRSHAPRRNLQRSPGLPATRCCRRWSCSTMRAGDHWYKQVLGAKQRLRLDGPGGSVAHCELGFGAAGDEGPDAAHHRRRRCHFAASSAAVVRPEYSKQRNRGSDRSRAFSLLGAACHLQSHCPRLYRTIFAIAVSGTDQPLEIDALRPVVLRFRSSHRTHRKLWRISESDCWTLRGQPPRPGAPSACQYSRIPIMPAKRTSRNGCSPSSKQLGQVALAHGGRALPRSRCRSCGSSRGRRRASSPAPCPGSCRWRCCSAGSSDGACP